jgi:glycosyltransferase involved in cell wall biosynthesis
MAQGTAVVSTAELGTLEVLREGEGVWIAPEEETEFAAKVVKLLHDDEARAQLGAAGRDYAHTWSAAKQAERMLDFYGEVLSAATVGDEELVLS